MAQVNVGSTIKQWRSWTTRSVDELSAVGTAFVWSLGLEPLPETTASDQISRRTIRYYISYCVMDPPEGERRLASYDYRHLLQLLYIKARQHAGDRLNEIRDAASGIDRDELEQRLFDVLPDSVAPPLPVDPLEFAQPGQLSAVLNRWAYLTGRQGRWPAREVQESVSETPDDEVAYKQASDVRISASLPQQFDINRRALRRYSPVDRDYLDAVTPSSPSSDQPRHLVHIPIDHEMELTVPADHPLVHDEDGRELLLRGIRRMIRDYLRGGRPAGRED